MLNYFAVAFWFFQHTSLVLFWGLLGGWLEVPVLYRVFDLVFPGFPFGDAVFGYGGRIEFCLLCMLLSAVAWLVRAGQDS